MVGIYTNHEFTDEERRELLFKGELLIYTSNQETRGLVNHASQLIQSSLAPFDPEVAQNEMLVESYVKRIGPLKSEFTNSDETKKLVRELLLGYGCNPEDTYFDVPRLRVVTHGNYLSSGVGYAYKPHRDTWYSSSESQVNWWLPVYDVIPARAMSFFPNYFTNPIKNSSAEFDYQQWCAHDRFSAMSQIKRDDRKHPVPLEDVDVCGEIRVASKCSELLIFSGSHLHATAANTSGLTRFSVDFRTVNIRDLREGRGARNIDNKSSGTTLGDFFNLSNMSSISLPVS